MFSSLKKFFTSQQVADPAPEASGNAQLDNARSVPTLVRRSGSGKTNKIPTGKDGVFDQDQVKILNWQMGIDNCWIKRILRTLPDKLPKAPCKPKLVNGVEFVLDKNSRPIVIHRGVRTVVFLVVWRRKLRALKVAFKESAGNKELVLEACLRQFVATTKATNKFYGLVAVESPIFSKCGLLTEFLGDDLGVKGRCLREMVLENQYKRKQQSGLPSVCEKEWKHLCLQLCNDIEKLQNKGIRLMDLNMRNIMYNPKKKKLVLVDLKVALLKGTTFVYDVGNLSVKQWCKYNPCAPPELFYHGNLSAESDTYSLARILKATSSCLGITPDEINFVMEPFLKIDPRKRPSTTQMRNMLQMFFENQGI